MSASIPASQEPIIVVSGLPRSGTSLMMKMLQTAAFDLLIDNRRQADDNNPNGYYEYESVKNLKTGSPDWLQSAGGRVVKVVSPLLQYLPGNYPYKVIFMQRDLGEVMASQSKMLAGLKPEGFKSNATPEQERQLQQAFRDHLALMDQWMARQPNMQVYRMNYNQLLAQPDSTLAGLAEFLQKPLPIQDMMQVIDPNLYRNRQGRTGTQPL